MGIAVLGSVFVDIKGYPFGTYIPGGRNAGTVQQVHGGVCRNIAEDIANIGLAPSFISLVDEGGAGADVVERLREHGCDTRWIRRTPDGMGTWLAVFDHTGDVVASISKRPDLLPIRDILLEHGDEIFREADSVVLELDMEEETVRLIYSLAEKWGKRVFAAVSNMSIAVSRREMLEKTACLVCNEEEAGILFSEDFSYITPEAMRQAIASRVKKAGMQRMIVTMGGKGAVFADANGASGICPPMRVDVRDTTGAGDAFFAGVAVGLTYGKSLAEACRIGTRLAASVIVTMESVCPRFLPAEFGLQAPEGKR